ncbi:MAG: hypothetical protein P8K76_16345 [Candidatus Binatia bacterium]|nr:hypothetical protein [Candidatus Binatia bacterium]MDG2011331.1 hypothetical protein [Candidatus Binatia bacterium]
MPRSAVDRLHLTTSRFAFLGLLFWSSLSLGAGPAAAAFLDYVYVDSNEGQASGGHVGLAFGGQIFHFQYREGGFLLPVRHATGAFERAYRVRENRNLRQHRIEVDQETYDLLRDGFNARYFESEVLLAELEDLRAEEAVLEGMGAGSRGVPIPGAGYFYPDGDARPEQAGLAGEIFSPDELADQLSRATEGGGTDLRAGSFFQVEGALGTLSPGQKKALRSLEGRLGEQLDSLAGSSRADVGEVRFVLLARRAVVAKSLASGQLHILDAYPHDAETIEVAEVEKRGGRLEDLLSVTENELKLGLATLQTGQAPSELDLSRLEDASNRRREIRRAMDSGRPLRIVGPRMLPGKPAWRTDLRVRALAGESRDRAIAANRESQSAILRKLGEQSSYNLITRNCVSEVFDSIDEIFGETEGADPVAVSMARLGGHVAGGQGFVFVPFVSSDAVAGNLRVAETIELPSYRSKQLARVYAREGDGALVYLRESNTLTSTIYRYNSEDSIFIFFTDDIVWARPVYGIVNLTAALAATVLGVPAAPFDRGQLLAAGARGAFWSLPELVFLSFRKGSFFTVPGTPEVGPQEDS